MYISQVTIQGYRNFRDATVNLKDGAAVMIGANDIGKSNFLQALRLLLDRNLSEAALEPEDSDFFAYEDVNEITIRLKFENVTEDCVLSKLKENVSANKELFLAYSATRETSGRKTYKILAGFSVDSLKEIEGRTGAFPF